MRTSGKTAQKTSKFTEKAVSLKPRDSAESGT